MSAAAISLAKGTTPFRYIYNNDIKFLLYQIPPDKI